MEDNTTNDLVEIAIENKQLEVLVYLLSKGAPADLKKIFQRERFVLHFSCFNGYTEVVKRLVQVEEIRQFLHSEEGCIALFFAAWNGHFEIVKHLLEIGINAKTKSKENMTALHLASLNGHLTVVKILLQSEAEVEETARFSQTLIKMKKEPEKNHKAKYSHSVSIRSHSLRLLIQNQLERRLF